VKRRGLDFERVSLPEKCNHILPSLDLGGASPAGRHFTSFRGFGDAVPERPWTFQDFRKGMSR
jgi:hypothetical protein